MESENFKFKYGDKEIPVKAEDYSVNKRHHTKNYYEALKIIENGNIPQKPIKEALEFYFNEFDEVDKGEKNSVEAIYYCVKSRIIVLRMRLSETTFEFRNKLAELTGWYFYVTGIDLPESDLSATVDRIRFTEGYYPVIIPLVAEFGGLPENKTEPDADGGTVSSEEGIKADEGKTSKKKKKKKRDDHKIFSLNDDLDDLGVFAGEPLILSNLKVGPNENSFMLRMGDRFFILDMGINPENREIVFNRLKRISDRILGVFISHSHMDHSSALYDFIEAFPDIPIFMSATTLDYIVYRNTHNKKPPEDITRELIKRTIAVGNLIEIPILNGDVPGDVIGRYIEEVRPSLSAFIPAKSDNPEEADTDNEKPSVAGDSENDGSVSALNTENTPQADGGTAEPERTDGGNGDDINRDNPTEKTEPETDGSGPKEEDRKNTVKPDINRITEEIIGKYGAKRIGFVRFYYAGHLPGALMLYMEFAGKKILYTGDFTLPSYPPIPGVDTVVKYLPANIDMLLADGCFANDVFSPVNEQYRQFHYFCRIKARNKNDILIATDPAGTALIMFISLHRYFIHIKEKYRFQLRPRIFMSHDTFEYARILVYRTEDLHYKVRRSIKREFNPFSSALIYWIKDPDDKNYAISRLRERWQQRRKGNIVIFDSANLDNEWTVEFLDTICRSKFNAIYLSGRLTSDGAIELISGNDHVTLRFRTQNGYRTKRIHNRAIIQNRLNPSSIIILHPDSVQLTDMINVLRPKTLGLFHNSAKNLIETRLGMIKFEFMERSFVFYHDSIHVIVV